MSIGQSPAQQLAAIDAARAIPDEDNAAVYYGRIRKMSPSLGFTKDFDTATDTLTLKSPWRTEDYPEVAEWIRGRQHILEAVLEAAAIERCVFPLPESFILDESYMNNFAGLRLCVFLLKRAAFNDLAEARNAAAYEKVNAIARMALHARQQPTESGFLVFLTLDALTLDLQFSLLAAGEATDKDLDILKASSRPLKPDFGPLLTEVAHVSDLLEKDWMKQFSLGSRLQYRWYSLFSQSAFEERVAELMPRYLSDCRALLIMIELRRFKNRTGHWPDSLGEVTASLDPVALQDPHGPHPFVYRQFGSDFVLYSVGVDGKDQNNKCRLGHNPDDWPIWPRYRSEGYKEWHRVNNPEFYKARIQ